MMKLLKKILYLALVSLFFSISLYAKKQEAILVTVVKPYSSTSNSKIEITGSAFFSVSSEVASETAGKVKKVFIEHGDTVKKDDPLVLLDDELISYLLEIAKVNTVIAKSNFDKAKKDFIRNKSLFEKKSIASSEFETFETAYNNSQNNYLSSVANQERIDAQKKNFLISSPIDGYVTNKAVEVGEWVDEGGMVADISSISYEARVNVPEYVLPYIKVNDKIEIQTSLKKYKGNILSINKKGDLLTRTFEIRIYLGKDKNLNEGTILRALIPTSKPIKALFLPRDAIVEVGSTKGVYIENNGVVNFEKIQVVGYRDKDIGVRGNITTKSNVILEGNNKVKVGNNVFTKIISK